MSAQIARAAFHLAETSIETETIDMITKKSIQQLILASLVAGATFGCSQTPAKAPGSNPEDMTPEGHRAAAQQEEQQAANHEQMKKEVGPSKPMAEETQKSQHQQQADQHENNAQQHEQAAEAAKGK